jgi:hypothetical protein
MRNKWELYPKRVTFGKLNLLDIMDGSLKGKNLTFVGNWTNRSLHAACRIFKNHMPLTTNKDCGKHFPEK